MARVCLNMIVKNESAILARCLNALAPHIDCYVVCDTGSTDSTVDLIRRTFEKHGVPGEVPTTTFRNFEQARNEALDAARASTLQFDYILFCDADMELVVHRPRYRDELTHGAYLVNQHHTAGHMEYPNVRLLRRDVPARYRGVTHEYVDVDPSKVAAFNGISFLDHASGSNRTTKYQRDIALLDAGLLAEPTNARYMFYLANSYYDMGDIATALKKYQRRAEMGGFAEEVFYSMYRIGQCYQKQSRVPEMVHQFLETFDAHPHRAEPLYVLGQHFQRSGRYRLAYHTAEIAARVPYPGHGLFVEAEVYQWRIAELAADAMAQIGQRDQARDLYKGLLTVVPESERARIFQSMQACDPKRK